MPGGHGVDRGCGGISEPGDVSQGRGGDKFGGITRRRVNGPPTNRIA